MGLWDFAGLVGRIVHPANAILDFDDWKEAVGQLGDGLWHTVTHPWELAGIDDIANGKPGRAVPDIILLLLPLKGIKAAKGAEAAAVAARTAEAATAARAAEEAAVAARAAEAARAAQVALEAAAAARAAEAAGTIKGAASQRAITEFVDGLPTRPTPANTAADAFEIAQTGPKNYTVRGGGSTVNADGVDLRTGELLEAKYTDNPAKSPYVDGSDVPQFLRDKVYAEQADEFRRYAQVAQDPANPFTGVRVIVSDPALVPYFQELMDTHGVPGRVVVAQPSPSAVP